MEQEQYFLIKIIYRHRKFIFIVGLLAALTAAIATSNFFMQPVYSSEIIFYPPSAAINRSFDNVKSFMVQDKEIEEQLQTILSGKTQEILISKYKLATHYGINASENDWRDDFKKEWENNFKVSRTRYNSISITVFDTDKNLAAQIANAAVSVADSIKSELLKNALRQNLKSFETDLLLKLSLADNVAASLGLNAGDIAFAPSLTGVIAVDLAQKQQAITNLLNTKNKNDFENRQPKVYKLSNLLRQLYDLENAISQLQIAIASPPLSSYVLSKAEPSYKKVSPKRTLITLFAFVGGLFFATAFVLFKQQWNKIKIHLN